MNERVPVLDILITFWEIRVSRYALCQDASKSSDHIFIRSPYMISMCHFIGQCYGIRFIWRGDNMIEVWKEWFHNISFHQYRALPVILMWDV